jgi:hypothetical protein
MILRQTESLVPCVHVKWVIPVVYAVFFTTGLCCAQKQFTWEKQFTLAGENGVAAQPVRNELVLDAKEEGTVPSKALLQTLEQQRFAVLERTSDPPLPKRDHTTENVPSKALLQTPEQKPLAVLGKTSEPLLPKRDYTTDIVPLSDQDVLAYNNQTPEALHLDPAHQFGIQFKLNFDIQISRDRFLRFGITPYLYVRDTASSEWRLIGTPYSGEYFARSFENALEANLVQKPPQN